MNRLLSSVLLGSTLALAVGVPAVAAPSGMTSALSAESGVQKVHGYHRSCVNGHRNRTDGVRVRCGGHYYQDSGPGITLQLNTRDRHNRNRHDRGDRNDRRDDSTRKTARSLQN